MRTKGIFTERFNRWTPNSFISKIKGAAELGFSVTGAKMYWIVFLTDEILQMHLNKCNHTYVRSFRNCRAVLAHNERYRIIC